VAKSAIHLFNTVIVLIAGSPNLHQAMKPLIVRLTLAALLHVAVGAGAAPFAIGPHQFTLPDGFEIQLAAGTNLVLRPVSASFDDQGRLYVTDSSGSNEKPAEQLKNPRHRVLRLEDTDGDGQFDQSVVFADKVMFPQGCLWHDGSVYVAAPPSIWKFTDADGDGAAEQREEWFQGGTLTGCANDIHGPHLGPDGYLYWTKGAFDEQTHKLGNGRVLKDRAAHIYRARPNGADLDVIMSGGMDNPVEVVFTPEGEALFTSTFIDFSQPGYRDGLAHAVYGGVFGKVNNVVEDGRVKRTSPELLHPFVQLGASVPSALCRYLSSAFGAGFQDNLFAAQFNLRKVTRHVLRPDGASYASTDSDFVVSDNLDFHPTDVLEDADGSLLIVDTGAWYKLCCPSSQLAKADVLGGLYRVRRTGAKPITARERADAYRRLTGPPPLREYSPEVSLKKAVWKAAPASAKYFRDTLNQHAQAAATKSESARLVRLAAEGLGRLRDKTSVPALLQAVSQAGQQDAVLSHSLIHALIEIADASAVRPALASNNLLTRRAALIALEQMDGGQLQAEEVTPHLAARDAALRQAAAWIAGRHPDWGGALAGFFRERLAAKGLSEAEHAELQSQLAEFAKDAAIHELLAATAQDSAAPAAARATALRAMGRAGLKEPPPAWHAAVTSALTGDDAELIRAAIAAARQLPVPKIGGAELGSALQRIGRAGNLPADVRLGALAAVPGGVNEVDGELFDFLLASLAPTQAVASRNAAANVMARAKLSEAQLTALADALKGIGPLEVPKVLPAFERAPSEALGLRLVAALKESKGAAALRGDVLRPRLTNFPAVVRHKGEELLASLNVDAAKQKAHLEALLAEVKGKGDVRRGQAIFNDVRTACLTCHAIGYQGGKVGPDLTRISEVRSERDLLEAIVYPSASFVRSYEPVIVATKDGEEHSGVLRRDAPEEVLLATGPTTEVRIPRADITEMRPGAVSVMPQGLDGQLSRQELADLLAFLKNTKWGPQ
jgi:putative membrane-bound dehydrogenase-like protein